MKLEVIKRRTSKRKKNIGDNSGKRNQAEKVTNLRIDKER